MVRRSRLRIVALAVVPGLAAACIGAYDIKAPPVPDATRTPMIAGVIAGWPPDNVTFRLEDGTVVDVGGPNSSAAPAALLSERYFGDGSLLLFGEDERGPFYAATRPKAPDGCFEIRGRGYIDPGRIHYSSGLVVPFAPDIDRENERSDFEEPTWLFEFDAVCLNDKGQVTLIHQFAFGS